MGGAGEPHRRSVVRVARGDGSEPVRLQRAEVAHRARTCAQLRSTLLLLDRPDAAIVLLEGERPVLATPSARKLLRRYFGADTELLLDALPSANRSREGEQLIVVEGPEGSLVVRATSSAVLLEEERSPSLLTPREREVLYLVGDGKTNAEIAHELWISPGTVRRHLENVFAKLGVHTRTAAAAFVHSRLAPAAHSARSSRPAAGAPRLQER